MLEAGLLLRFANDETDKHESWILDGGQHTFTTQFLNGRNSLLEPSEVLLVSWRG